MAVNAQWCISVEYRDAKGQTRKVTVCFWNNNATGAGSEAGLFAAASGTVGLIQALSNAAVQSGQNPFPNTPLEYRGLAYGAPDEYQSVAQQAVLSYSTVESDGSPNPGVARLTICAPKIGIFLPDGITVDPANTDVVALNSFILAPAVPVSGATGLATRSGLVAKSFIGGVFIGRKISRKMNKYVYNPELTVRGI